MNEPIKRAREQYRSIEPPQELSFAVSSALRRGEQARKTRRAGRRALATVMAACACFMLLVNVNPGFAKAVSEVPVLGQLARIFTVTEYTINDRNHLIDVRLPALENTGSTDLEQRINSEIQIRIDQVLAEAEQRARQARDAFVSTGGREEGFIPIIIDVDYEIKCQSDQYLSFILYKTETIASAYTELYTYNIDLKAGAELSLPDLLGPDYISLANSAVQAGIEQQLQEDPNSFFFNGENGIDGFTSIKTNQKFYINQAGNPVILFDQYEIAPGYMGQPEFEVPSNVQ